MLTLGATGQSRATDSLKQLIRESPADSSRVILLLDLAQEYFFSKPDSCLLYTEEALGLAREMHLTQLASRSLNYAGEALRFLGDYPQALKMQMEAIELNRKLKDKKSEAVSLVYMGLTYVEFKEYRLGLDYLLPSLQMISKMDNQIMETFTLTNIGDAYNMLEKSDSALYYQRLAYQTYTGLTHGPLKSLILTRYGNAWASKGNKDSALIFYHAALQNAIVKQDGVNQPKIQRRIAELYEAEGKYDSSLYYARQSFVNAQRSNQSLEIFESSKILVKLFHLDNNIDSAFFYQDKARQMSDRLYGPQKFKQLQLLVLQEQERQQKIVSDQEKFRNKIKFIALLSVLAVFLLLAFLLIRTNRHKQKANILLQQQKNKIEHTLEELKTTQKQLIQSEKMASLGELTAGIAHEIQNPLNFVNNFSEVNTELIEELRSELASGNMQQAKEIANDIKENEKKINHHGKRADAIVKGMLQHSRRSSGVKEPTNINELADEYLRLAYHGLRAKDKSFNATMKTNYDVTVGNINIIPQDLGRVILNLITNAFYAVNEKKSSYGKDSGDKNYEPTVSVITKKINNRVEISVADNGNGIPPKVIDKIFQPFFTTKPTGQGTGLGLSLSYDIVKAHGGELKVETSQGEGSVFTIILPADITNSMGKN